MTSHFVIMNMKFSQLEETNLNSENGCFGRKKLFSVEVIRVLAVVRIEPASPSSRL